MVLLTYQISRFFYQKNLLSYSVNNFAFWHEDWQQRKKEIEAFILVWFMESGSNMPKFEKSLEGPQECHVGLGLLNQIMKPTIRVY